MASLGARSAAAQGVDPREDWRTLATPHFRVHFPARMEAQGRRAAADAERAWRLLAAELTPPRGPVDLVVADNVDFTQGYARVVPSPRITVYAQPPVDVPSLRFYDDWSALVITHELTHVFHLDRSRGVWRLGQRVMGRSPLLFPNTYLPSWITEGLAVYYESRLTGAGRVAGTEHRLLARAAAVEGRLPALNQLSQGTSSFPGGEIAYAYGSLVLDWMARTQRAGGVHRFVERTSAGLVPFRIDAAARGAFGLSFSSAWRRWSDSVVASVGGVTATGDGVDADPLGGWRELTREGWYAAYPRWRTASSLVYAAEDARSATGAFGVAANGARTRLGRRNSLSPNVPLPDGSLLFAQLDYVDPFTVRGDLWVQRAGARAADFGAASAGQRRLTRGARLSHPDARRDGAIVAVQSVAGTTRLVRVSTDGRIVAPLTTAAPDTQWAEPRWSPDGARIAAVRLERGGRSAVTVLDSLGRPLADVVSDRAVNAAPAWSADGNRLYWSSDRTGAPELYAAVVSDSTGTLPAAAPVRLTGVRTGVVQPAPAPGGDALAALLQRADGQHLVVRDAAGAGVPAAGDSTYYAQRSTIGASESATGRVTRYRPWRTLAPRYWTPIAGEADGGSTTLGAATSGTDVIGRHAYAAQLSANTRTGDVEGDASWRYTGLGQPFVDLAASQAWQYSAATTPPTTGGRVDTVGLSRRTRAASAALTLTRPRYRTRASFTLGAQLEQRAYESPSASVAASYAERLGRTFPSVFASGAWSNARRPLRSVSPEDGVGVSFSAQQRWQDGALGPLSRRVVGAARAYKSLDLPGFAHHVLALRVAGGAADARTATEFTAGGVSGAAAELLPGIVVGDPARTFGARGFAAGAQRGVRAAAASLEYRAPVAVAGRGLWLLPVFFDRVSATAFADAATAWCPSSVDRRRQTLCSRSLVRSPDAPRWLASVGAELNLDAALQYDVPYRFRFGVAVPVAERAVARRASAYATLGLPF